MTSRVFGNRYEATGAVMVGGGGEVYVCKDPNLDRVVAVKLLRPGIDAGRLKDEIAALQKIRSKNVVQVLDLVEDPSFGVGVVTEFLSGSDLSDPNGFPSDHAQILKLVYQIANGVADIHAAGIVHRDLKPNNAKFDAEKIIKIFDFNLARDGFATHTVGFRGTHGFAAPEQYGPAVVRVTQEADVYALAATVAYLGLGGRLPRQLLAQPPRPALWKGGFGTIALIDRDLVPILDSALSPVPDTRPKASEIRDLARSLLRRDAHRATIAIRGDPTVYYLDAKNRVAQLAHSSDGGGVVVIKYDGLGFVVQKVSGVVLVNHELCAVGRRLPDSCVIDLGSPSGSRLAIDRLFVTFDVSHPEVVQ